MRFLLPIFCLWLGFANANIYKRVAPAVDEALNAFKDGMSQSGSLRDALDLPNVEELDQVERDIKTELSKNVKEILEQLLENLRQRIKEGRDITEELLRKVKEVRKYMKDTGIEVSDRAKELLESIKAKVKDVVQKLLEKYGLQRRSLNDELHTVTSSEFEELIKKVRENILDDDTVNKMREYVLNLKSDNPLVKAVQEEVRKMNDKDLRDLIRFVYQRRLYSRDLKDIWEKVKDFFKGLKENLKEKTLKFQEWMKETLDEGFSKLKDKYGMIQALAREVMSHAKDLHGEIAREAIEFFRPYKDDLGGLWKKLYELLEERVGTF